MVGAYGGQHSLETLRACLDASDDLSAKRPRKSPQVHGQAALVRARLKVLTKGRGADAVRVAGCCQ